MDRVKGIHGSADESKLSLQYNSSSIPYLQRNRRKYNNFLPEQVKGAQFMPKELNGETPKMVVVKNQL